MGTVRFAVALLICRFGNRWACRIRHTHVHRVGRSIATVEVAGHGNLLSSAGEDTTNSSGYTFNDMVHANLSDHEQSQPSGRETEEVITNSTVTFSDTDHANHIDHWHSQQSGGEAKEITTHSTVRLQDLNLSSAKFKMEHHHGVPNWNPSQTQTGTLLPHVEDGSWVFVTLWLLMCALVLIWMCCWNNAQSISRQNGMDDGLVEEPIHVGFEWCYAEQLLYYLDAPCDLGIESVPPPWTADTTRQVLVSNGIDAHAWSEGQLAELSNQLSSGLVCMIRGSTGELQIRVDIVQIILTCPRDWVVLQVESPPPDNSDSGKFREQDPEGRMNRKETLWESTLRCLFGQTGAQSFEVKFESMTNATQKNEWNVDQVPGILTVTRRYTVHASVTASTRADLDQFVLGSQGLKAERRAYKWVSLQSYEMPSVPTMRTALNDFNTAILPWNVAAVQSLMEMHGIIDPVESFGKTLEDLSCALSAGKLSLGVIKSENRLMCIIEEVSLLITSIEGTVFISPGSLRMLPTTVKLSNENIHMAAFRLLQEFFGMHAPLVEIEHQTVVTDKLATSKGHVTRTILVFAKMNVPVNSLTRWDVTNKARKPTST